MNSFYLEVETGFYGTSLCINAIAYAIGDSDVYAFSLKDNDPDDEYSLLYSFWSRYQEVKSLYPETNIIIWDQYHNPTVNFLLRRTSNWRFDDVLMRFVSPIDNVLNLKTKTFIYEPLNLEETLLDFGGTEFEMNSYRYKMKFLRNKNGNWRDLHKYISLRVEYIRELHGYMNGIWF